MSAVAIKVGLGFVTAAILYEVLQAETVLNATMLFVTAGVIPGTDIVLSPDATILTVVVVLLGIVLLWNRKRIMVGLRHPRAEVDPEVPMLAIHMSAFSFPRPRRPSRISLAIGDLRSLLRTSRGRATTIVQLSLILRLLIFRKRLAASTRQLDIWILALGEWLERVPSILQRVWNERKPAIYARLLKVRASFDRWLSSQ